MRRISNTHLKTVFTLAVAACLALVPIGTIEAQEEGAAEMTDWTNTQTSAGNTMQSARMLYGQGVRQLKRATKLAERAEAESDETKRAELLASSTEANQEAVANLMQALQTNADFFEAYEQLGTAFRRLDKHQEALEVHAIALRRDPESMETFEGWADALMNLNMLGNAVASYEKYAEEDSPRAPILMAAIKDWLAEMERDPGELDPEHVEKMAEWVAQQESG